MNWSLITGMTPGTFFLIAGFALILIELALMQMSVFWFLFIGLGALATGLLSILFDLQSWPLTAGLFILTSTLISLSLGKTLKRWQASNQAMSGNDAIGQTVAVIEPVSEGQAGKVSWSGTEWPAELAAGIESDQPIEPGQAAVIVAVEGITLKINRKNL